MKLTDEARQFWRLWSVRLAAVAGVAAAVMAENPALLLGLLAHLPAGPMRTMASIAIGLIVFAIPTLTRLLRQPEKKGQADG